MPPDDSATLFTYISDINDLRSSGVATEQSYRPSIKDLLEDLGPGHTEAINEPKRIACGAPDSLSIIRGFLLDTWSVKTLECPWIRKKLRSN